MNNNSNLKSFVKDGLELVIDLKTGASYAPGYRALARICSLGLEKPVRDEQVRRHVSSLIEGATVSPLLEAEIQTAGGLQGATLVPENLMAKTIRKFNEPLSEKIDEAGVRVLAHKLAGYQIQSTAAPRHSYAQPKPTPGFESLSTLTHGQLKRLFYYRSNIDDGASTIEELVEDIDPVFWNADIASISLAFEQYCLDLEERALKVSQRGLNLRKRSIRLRKKDIANLQSGKILKLLPDFGKYYEQPMFEQDDRWIIEGR